MDDVYVTGGDFTIVSGGQTGADRAGLDWAISRDVRQGGWCPRGRKTGNGVLPAVRPGVHPKYVARFLQRHAVATLNVAGKRASGAPGIGRFVHAMLSQAVCASGFPSCVQS